MLVACWLVCRYTELVARTLKAVVMAADDLLDVYTPFAASSGTPPTSSPRNSELVDGIPYMLRGRWGMWAAG